MRIADCQAHIDAGSSTPPRASIAAPTSQARVSDLYVIDDAIPHPHDYRRYALAQRYRSVPVGPATFHGIAECDDAALPFLLSIRFPDAQPGLTFFRQSPAGQVEPNFIHTDRDMGDWTAILYLSDTPPEGDGTTFWESRATGARASTAQTDEDFRSEWTRWREPALWRPWHTVAARFNRLIVFPAPLFHSRAIAENYGTAGHDARLIQLVFGRGPLGERS